MSTVIGGAMLPHAPQFFTMPETEDKKVVAHVREVAAEIGKKLRGLKPDLWIIFSNDHAEQFFHTSAPPFTVHVGGEAGEGQTRAAIAIVIAGLDPAIHPVRKKVLTKKMDPRVKPAGDERVA